MVPTIKKAIKSALAGLCLVACCPLCFPCYICAFKNRKRRLRQLQTRDVDIWTGPKSPSNVHPLSTRKRRLSLSNSMERPRLEPEQQVNMQEQALLFVKLPPELRMQIWEEVVGGYEVYLGIVTRRIRHCKIFGGLGIARCYDIDEDEQDRLQSEHRLLPVLMTCRRVYTEAIQLLYSTNQFTTSHLDIIHSLTSSLRLPRFNSISSFSITWSLPVVHRAGLTSGMRKCDTNSWNRASHILASMKGLKELKIIVWGCTIYGSPRDWTGIKELLDMLRRVTRPKQYTVTIDEAEAEELINEYDDAPFQLKWGCDDRDALLYG